MARKDYNDLARQYNSAIRRIPGSLLAGPLGFEKKDYFEPPEGQAAVQRAPTVTF